MTVTRGNTYTEPGYTCTTSTGANCHSSVQISGSVDTSQVGTYTLTYRYTDVNSGVLSQTRTVNVVAGGSGTGTASLVLEGNNPMRIGLRESYGEPGYTCTTSTGADCYDHVVVSGHVNTDVLGVYPIDYTYTDPISGRISLRRMVHVTTSTATITLSGAENMNIPRGSIWIEPGYTCTTWTGANCNDVTTVSGSIDTNTLGTYTLIYRYRAQHLGYGGTNRTVNVVDSNTPPLPQPPGSGSLTLRGDNPVNVNRGSSYIEAGWDCRTST